MGNKDNGIEKLSSTEEKMTLKAKQAKAISQKYRIARFRGATVYKNNDGWDDLSYDEFARMCYEVHGAGIRQTHIKDLQHLFFSSSDDLTKYATYIAMPDGRVWDMQALDFTQDVPAEDCVYTTAVSPTDGKSHRKWLEEVTLGDKELADDVIQALAPIFMYKKPLGAFWFLGSGANGKNTTIKSIYNIMGGQRWFTKFTVKQIEDERDLPRLNGKLANLCIESSEGYIKDGGYYKELAEHGVLEIHKFNSQEGLKVDGNLHLIFNANNIPTFADKTNGVRRRTFTIPFNAKFPQDDTFDERLFSQDRFLSDLFGEILETTKKLRDNNYKYDFSKVTNQAKERYDSEVNTAEAYLTELLDQEIYGFSTYHALKNAYNIWCEQSGVVALGVRHLSRTAEDMGWTYKGIRVGGKVMKFGLYKDYKYEDMRPVDNIGFGLYQLTDSDKDLILNEDNTDSTYDKLLELL